MGLYIFRSPWYKSVIPRDVVPSFEDAVRVQILRKLGPDTQTIPKYLYLFGAAMVNKHLLPDAHLFLREWQPA